MNANENGVRPPSGYPHPLTTIMAVFAYFCLLLLVLLFAGVPELRAKVLAPFQAAPIEVVCEAGSEEDITQAGDPGPVYALECWLMGQPPGSGGVHVTVVD